MTTGAGNRQPLECLGQRVDLVVDDIGPELAELVAVVMAHFAEPEECSCQNRFVLANIDGAGFRQEISGHMLPDELIIRDV